MKTTLVTAMRKATQALQAQKVATATRIIQQALSGRMPRLQIHPPEPALPSKTPLSGPGSQASSFALEFTKLPHEGRTLGSQTLKSNARLVPVPEGSQYLSREFACAAGRRSYKLFIPACVPAELRGLVVMLHGCKQGPDDFARGTHMNEVAQANGLLVAYPLQPRSANASSCWNWFNPADQQRNQGEPAILAGIASELMAEFGLQRRQVFVAGLSAGGAMAVVMGKTYPDLFAAVGTHSGLAYRSAGNVATALAVMQNGRSSILRPETITDSSAYVRTIVFQGSADRTVAPANADAIMQAASTGVPQDWSRIIEKGSKNGRNYVRTVVTDPAGVQQLDSWLVEAGGHAWFGGKPEGSYTDQRGPDASALMVKFFLDQPNPTNSA